MKDVELVRELAITTPFTYGFIKYVYFECLDRWAMNEALEKTLKIINYSCQLSVHPSAILDLIPKSTETQFVLNAESIKKDFLLRTRI